MRWRQLPQKMPETLFLKKPLWNILEGESRWQVFIYWGVLNLLLVLAVNEV